MNPLLLLALFKEIGIPELERWLRSRHAAGQTVTDADIAVKLVTDTNFIKNIGNAWLATHPETP